MSTMSLLAIHPDKPDSIEVFQHLTGKLARIASRGKVPVSIEMWLDIADAANVTGISTHFMRDSCQAKELTYYRTGTDPTMPSGKILIPYSNLDEWRRNKFLRVARVL